MERSTKIAKSKSFVNKYNWEEINYASEKDDWKKLEKSNVLSAKKIYIYLAYVLIKKKLLF